MLKICVFFSDCHNLKKIIGISNFDTTNVIYMRCMFAECYELVYLNLFSFTTSKVIDMV